MLQFIRDRAQSWIAFVIVGLLVLALAAVAWEAYFRADPIVAAARVNGEKVTARDFQRAYQSQRARLQQMLGGVDLAQIIPDEEQFKQNILDQLIRSELILQSANNAGYQIGDAYLNERIRSLSDFQTDGRFDPELYQRLLRQYFGSRAAFESVIRRDEVVDQYRLGVAATAWLSPREESYLLAKQEQQREIKYFDIPAADFFNAIVVSGDDVRKSYDDNQSLYMTTEQLSVEYLELSLDDLMQGISVANEDLKELYDTRKSDFGVEEERRTRHILLENGSEDDAALLARIQTLRATVHEDMTFEEAAKKFSDDVGSAAQGGDLGFLTRDMMLDSVFADAAFSLSKEGEVTEPVKSKYGYHLIELVEIKVGEAKPFEEVKSQLEKDYRLQQAEDAYFEQGEVLANLTFENPDTLTVAAEELGLTVKTSALFSQDAGLGVAMDANVRLHAFSDDVLVAGNNSERLDLDGNRVVVLRVSNHYPSTMREFDQVKDGIVERLRRQRAQDQAELEGNKILARLMENNVNAAELNGRIWSELGLLRRSAVVAQEIVAQAFKMSHPEEGGLSYAGFAKNSGDYSIVAVSKIEDGDVAAIDEAQRTRLVENRQRYFGRVELDAVVETMVNDARIVKFPENL